MPYKRAKILINKKFQLRFAFFVCSWIFTLSMIYPIIIYNVFEYFMNFIPMTTPGTIDRFKGIQGQVIFLLAMLQILFLIITFLISIFLSHRIAGPIFKIRKAMDDVTRGNFDQRVTFRKNDHFTELQDTFNEMVQHLAIRKWR